MKVLNPANPCNPYNETGRIHNEGLNFVIRRSNEINHTYIYET